MKYKFSTKNKIVGEIFQLLQGNFIATLISFTNVIVIGRCISPEEFGTFSVGFSICMFTAIVSTPIINLFATYIPRYLVNDDRISINNLYRYVARILVFVFIGASTIIVLFARNISSLLNIDSVIFVLMVFIYMIIDTALCMNRGVITGFRNFSVYNKTYYVESISRIIITLILLSFFKNATFAFLPYLVAAAITLIYSLLELFKKKFISINFSKFDVKEINAFFLPLILLSLSFMLFNTVDMLFAKRYLSSYYAGLYGAVSQISKGILIMGGSFHVLLLPYMSHNAATNQSSYKLVSRIIGGFLFLSTIAIVTFLLAGDFIIKTLYGVAYCGTKDVLVVLSIGAVFMTIASMFGRYFLVVKAYYLLFIPFFFSIIECILLFRFHNSGKLISTIFAMSIGLSVVVMLGAIIIINFRTKIKRSLNLGEKKYV